VAYVVALAGLTWLQSYVLYPGRYFQGTKASRVTPPPGGTAVSLTTPSGDTVRGIYLSAPAQTSIRRPPATVLFLYGNAMNVAMAVPALECANSLGCAVLCIDYPGYGQSSGRPSEKGCYEAAEAAYTYLTGARGVEPERLIVVGWSLGGAVAIDLASKHRVGGLAALCTFSSMSAMAHRRLPMFPTGLMLRERFDSAGKMPNVRCPVLLGFGAEDRTVPAEEGNLLAAAAGGPVTRLLVPGYAHNDFLAPGNRALWRALGELVEKTQNSSDPSGDGPRRLGAPRQVETSHGAGGAWRREGIPRGRL
jgi:hypothetical protein